MSAAAECSTDSLGAVFDRRKDWDDGVWMSEAWGQDTRGLLGCAGLML